MLPREFARLKQAGGLGGAQPPPICKHDARIRPLKLLPKSSTEGPAGIKPLRRLKLLPEPITPFKLLPKPSKKGPANIRPLKLLPKPSAEGPASITPLNLLPKGPASIRPLKLLPKPSTEGGAWLRLQWGTLGGGFKGA